MTDDAVATAAAVRSSATTAEALIDGALARIAAVDPKIVSFNEVLDYRARFVAGRMDKTIANGDDPGDLAGAPFGVTASFAIAMYPTTAGARVLSLRGGGHGEATVVSYLRSAGAIPVGILNMDEFAFGFTTENAHFGTTRNPHDLNCMAGGSSGGSAAAVAAGLVPIAFGSETNGSVRVPAAICGVYGFKPTYGRVSRNGMYPLSWSLDNVGWFARSVRDLAAVLDIVQGPDPDDPACSTISLRPVSPRLAEGVGHLRIAIGDGYFAEGGDPMALSAVIRVARALGATRGITLMHSQSAAAASLLIAAAEGASKNFELLRTRAEQFDPQTRDRWLAAAMIPAAWVHAAQRFRTMYRDDVLRMLKDIDVLITPTTPCAAPRIGQTTIRIDDADMPIQDSLGRYTAPFSFVGLPALSVPVWLDGPLPYGVQLVGRPFGDEAVLRVAATLESAGVAKAPVATL